MDSEFNLALNQFQQRNVDPELIIYATRNKNFLLPLNVDEKILLASEKFGLESEPEQLLPYVRKLNILFTSPCRCIAFFRCGESFWNG
jgi:hypothetical protein